MNIDDHTHNFSCARDAASRNQTGISIIEILIALALGTLLAAGVIRVFASSQASNAVILGEARLSENSRYAIDAMAYQLRLAGYRSQRELLPSEVFTAAEPAITATAATAGAADSAERAVSVVLGGTTYTTQVKANTDTIAVRYQGGDDNTITNCAGQTVASGAMALDLFYVGAAGVSDASDFTLYCRQLVQPPGGSPVDNGSVPIAGDIRALAVLLGEDTSGDNEVNRLRTPDAVTADSTIVSAQLALTVDGGRPLSVTDLARGSVVSEDLRRDLSRTVSLRNLMR